MPIASGTRLGPFEISSLLGAGGMGEVYRATDTKLRREVAIKVLPPTFARDPERLARFEREAQVLASLNNPHIAAIYGLEHADNERFLVLELVEGPTLAERLAAGPLLLAEAIRVAIEIARALEAAHEKNIIHRDLKPANIKLTAGGSVKVLDFGLAKAFGEPELAADFTHSPTVTSPHTRSGVILGTAAYMSPEQAEGQVVDKRADVWAFGVMLYELLSGRRAFDGKTTSHVIVNVMEKEPDWSALPASTPPGVRDLIERCLQKDPTQRPRDIGDLRLQLQALSKQAASGRRAAPQSRAAVEPATRERSRWLWPGVAAALLLTTLAALGVALAYMRRPPLP